MTREHLVEDIRNVLELVNHAEQEPRRREEANNALRGLFRHVENETDVPGTVRGCLQEAVTSTESGDAGDGAQWRSARACLEAALEFARGE